MRHNTEFAAKAVIASAVNTSVLNMKQGSFLLLYTETANGDNGDYKGSGHQKHSQKTRGQVLKYEFEFRGHNTEWINVVRPGP